MISASAKMIMTAALSCVAVGMYVFLGGRSRRSCMLAMLLSSLGDVFMVDGIINWSLSTYVGAAFFISAHFVYADCFRKNGEERGFKYFGTGFYAGAAFMLLSVVMLAVLELTVPTEKMPLMFGLILIYIAVIGYNLCSGASFGFSAGGMFLVLPAALAVFYITDIFIFLDMLNIEHSLRSYVWYAYPAAQLCLVLFNSEFKKLR